VISSSKGRTRALRRRGTLMSLFAVAAALAFLGAAGTASASKVNCAGGLGPSVKDPESKTAAEYSFLCDQDVLAFSINFNKQIAIFEPEVLAFTPAGEGSGELASCEGHFPGAGLGCTFQSSSCPSASSSSTSCTGKASAGNTVKGEVESMKPRCAQTRKQKTLEAWLTVTTREVNASGKSFVIASQPFHLDNDLGCEKPEKSRH
jgi:hypothetical protein